MKILFACLISLFFASGNSFADANKKLSGTWQISTSALTWHVDHKLHTSEGKSTQAKGKAQCKDNICEILVAAPVKSFDSENGNRDAHMLEIVRGESHPMVVVRAKKFKLEQLSSSSIQVPLDIEFAGQSHHIDQAKLIINSKTPNSISVDGDLQLKLSDFKIERPALLGVSVKDEFYVRVSTVWNEVQ